jgi:hypothetical protein
MPGLINHQDMATSTLPALCLQEGKTPLAFLLAIQHVLSAVQHVATGVGTGALQQLPQRS